MTQKKHYGQRYLKRPVSSPGLWIGDLVAQIGVLSHDGSGQGRSSVSWTHDHALIIPGISEELEPLSLQRSQ